MPLGRLLWIAESPADQAAVEEPRGLADLPFRQTREHRRQHQGADDHDDHEHDQQFDQRKARRRRTIRQIGAVHGHFGFLDSSLSAAAATA